LNKERVSSIVKAVLINFWASFVIILRFRYTSKISFISPTSSKQRIVSSKQLLLNKYCFYQSSFYFNNVLCIICIIRSG